MVAITVRIWSAVRMLNDKPLKESNAKAKKVKAGRTLASWHFFVLASAAIFFNIRHERVAGWRLRQECDSHERNMKQLFKILFELFLKFPDEKYLFSLSLSPTLSPSLLLYHTLSRCLSFPCPISLSQGLASRNQPIFLNFSSPECSCFVSMLPLFKLVFTPGSKAKATLFLNVGMSWP